MKLINGFFKKNQKEADNEAYENYYSHSGAVPGKQSSEHRQAFQSTVAQYKCPMGCEGDKTYNKPGNCPICNMKLVPVEKIIHEPTQNRIVK